MDEPELSDDEVKVLLRIRIEQATRRVAMLAFLRDEPRSPAGVDNNGTVSFLHLPGGKFIVTNYHVWDHFRTERENDSTYQVALTGKGFSELLVISDAELISESRQLDLCVLKYPPGPIELLGKEFCRPPQWPLARAEEGDDVSTTGFPGIRRTPDERPHPLEDRLVPVLHHESVILYLHVEGVSNRQALFKFTNPTPEIFEMSSKPPKPYRWGGMSGSLVYRRDMSENRFFPCGILHGAGEGLDATFFATHLDFIQEDGTIVEP